MTIVTDRVPVCHLQLLRSKGNRFTCQGKIDNYCQDGVLMATMRCARRHARGHINFKSADRESDSLISYIEISGRTSG